MSVTSINTCLDVTAKSAKLLELKEHEREDKSLACRDSIGTNGGCAMGHSARPQQVVGVVAGRLR